MIQVPKIHWQPWEHRGRRGKVDKEGWQAKVGNDVLLVWKFTENGCLYWSELNGQLLTDSHTATDARLKCERAYKEELAARAGG